MGNWWQCNILSFFFVLLLVLSNGISFNRDFDFSTSFVDDTSEEQSNGDKDPFIPTITASERAKQQPPNATASIYSSDYFMNDFSVLEATDEPKTSRIETEIGLFAESNCYGTNIFVCYTGECINGTQICNGYYDCPLGEDESLDCGEWITMVFALVSMVIGTLFAFLFMYMYYLRVQMLEEDVFVRPGGDMVSDSYRRYVQLVEIALKMTEDASRKT
uniref:uncharacterized protein LOC120331665 n=1 Tax=Styela clava TaxID=7725 RepID=UPI00193A7F8D|nr:uncharacterized protein LOC120331665 [Styela clava]